MVDLNEIKNIYLYASLISISFGIPSLTNIIETSYTKEEIQDSLFVFFGKNKSQIKTIEIDDTGEWLYQKRLTISNVASVENKGVISQTTGSALNVVDDKFSFAAVSGASRYEMVFSFIGAANAGGTASVVFKLTADDITNVNAYSWVDEESVTSKTQTSQYGTTVYTSGNNYVLVGDEIKLKNQPSVTVFAYDANGNVLAVFYTYSYAK